MTIDEFEMWLRHLFVAYPEASAQFKKTQTDGQRASVWFEALSDVTRTMAAEAIDSMVCGRIERPQYGWSDLPKIVLDYVKTRTSNEIQQYYADRATDQHPRCDKCQDRQDGTVLIWNPWFVRDLRTDIWACESKEAVWPLWRKWRRQYGKRGDALRLTVICDCDNPVSTQRREQLDQHRRGEGDSRVPSPRDVYRAIFHEWHAGEPRETHT